ncbi:4755_t:CDS:2 [Racocetra fulgida]|uniref:4755_t:CDS:1 n=1 Tax=Racocetra fulgida TaxID=60492 RepID=A0A9N8ZW01_9GLOM|nr:4755_t:CDS:2 [Racocetra fulgida]
MYLYVDIHSDWFPFRSTLTEVQERCGEVKELRNAYCDISLGGDKPRNIYVC